MLKLLYFGHLMQRANSLEKPLMLERFGGRMRSGKQTLREDAIRYCAASLAMDTEHCVVTLGEQSAPHAHWIPIHRNLS